MYVFPEARSALTDARSIETEFVSIVIGLPQFMFMTPTSGVENSSSEELRGGNRDPTQPLQDTTVQTS